MKRISVAGLVLVAMLALNGVMVSSASAAEPLDCYKTDKPGHGIFSDPLCLTEVAKLTGNYVRATPLEKKTENLWCALVETRPNGKSGEFKNAMCTEAESDGLYTVVVIEPLPLFLNAAVATSTSGKGELSLEGAKISCEKDVGTFGAGTRLGTFSIDFKECSALAEPCKGLGQTAGLIEVKGEWHLVSLLADRKHYEIWFLLAASDNSSAVHIECEAIGLALVWGSLLGLITKLSSTDYDIFVEKEGSGSTAKQKITEFGNNAGGTVKVPGLKAKLGTGTERTAGLASASNLLTSSSIIDES